MIILYILGGIVAVVLLLLCVPMQLCITYNEQLGLTLKYFFIPVQILPKRVKEDKPKNKFVLWAGRKWKALCGWTARIKTKLKSKKQPAAKKKRKPAEEKSSFAVLREQRGFIGMLGLLWRVVSLAAGAMRGVMKTLVVDKFDFRAKVGGEDAAQIAVDYGEWCSVLFPALAFILSSTRRYKQNIIIEPDFESGETSVEIDAIVRTVPLFVVSHALAAFLKLIWREIKDKIADAVAEAKINISEQGGATNG